MKFNELAKGLTSSAKLELSKKSVIAGQSAISYS